MTVPFDPVTGEVLELDTAQVRAVAAEYNPAHSMLEKVKAKGCCAPVWECDIDGNPVVAS